MLDANVYKMPQEKKQKASVVWLAGLIPSLGLASGFAMRVAGRLAPEVWSDSLVNKRSAAQPVPGFQHGGRRLVMQPHEAYGYWIKVPINAMEYS